MLIVIASVVVYITYKLVTLKTWATNYVEDHARAQRNTQRVK